MAHKLPTSVMSHTDNNMLATLNPTLNNYSATSLTSEAAIFHSAPATPFVEKDHSFAVIVPRNTEAEPLSVAMSWKDSGYEVSHGRRSTSTSSSRTRPPRYSASSTSPRPLNKRASRSATFPLAQRTSLRPGLSSRYGTFQGPEGSKEAQAPHQFFQFPSFPPPAPTPDIIEPAHPPSPSSQPPIPPATIHYFLLPETRRLEYAAIDAASRGLRGFITKLLPDCILPSEFRCTKFHDNDQDSDDAGSVRRYRLRFPDPEEKGVIVEGGSSSQWREVGSTATAGKRAPRRGVWRRMMAMGKA